MPLTRPRFSGTVPYFNVFSVHCTGKIETSTETIDCLNFPRCPTLAIDPTHFSDIFNFCEEGKRKAELSSNPFWCQARSNSKPMLMLTWLFDATACWCEWRKVVIESFCFNVCQHKFKTREVISVHRMYII